MKYIVYAVLFISAYSSSSFAAVDMASPEPATQERDTASQPNQLERFSAHSFRCLDANESNYRETHNREPSIETRERWVEQCARNSEL